MRCGKLPYHARMGSPRIHHWTDQHQQRLLGIVRDGRLTVTLTEAVEILGFPQFPLITELKRQNIKTRGNRGRAPYRKPAEPHMLTTHARGARLTVPLTAIARQYGCSYPSLQTVRAQLGLHTKWDRFVWTPGHMATLLSLMDANGKLTVGVTTAARHIGCTPKALSQKLWKMRNAR
jgi:hypothetical protein